MTRPDVRPGRGAPENRTPDRFNLPTREADGDWLDEREALDEGAPPLRTTVTVEHARTIITRNQSPDIGFDRSINPYRGCEHGCIYCFARPTHAFHDLSPGLDFETKLFAKPDAAKLLRAELASLPAPADGGRTGAVMAGMVEEARWRTSARGRRYLMATMSDSSGQFVATVFDDDASAQVEAAAKSGACALLNVELDRRPGEEAPRVTIRSLQMFESLSRRTRLQMEVVAEDEEAVRRLAAAVAGDHGGNGELKLRLRLGEGEAELLLGRDFLLDAEMAARIERLDGIESVHLSVIPQLKLALVS